MPPPPREALTVLPLTMLLLSVSAPAMVAMPPPPAEVLPLTVLLLSVTVPKLAMPAPAPLMVRSPLMSRSPVAFASSPVPAMLRGIGVSRHGDDVGTATGGAGVNGGVRVGRLDRLPQRAIAVGVNLVVGGVYGACRGVYRPALREKEQRDERR